MVKKFLSDYLSFSRKERTGITVILVLIIFFTLLPFLFPLFIKQKTQDHFAFEKDIATLKYKQSDSAHPYAQNNFDENNYQNFYQPSEKKIYDKTFKGELFYFDPNTLSTDGWKKLGVKEKTINTIQNYLSKGGKFNKPEDISKIWGLPETEVQRLLPYVTIKHEATSFYNKKNDTINRIFYKSKYNINPVDINTADTSAFIALPGIGSKLANRIINFRNKLGGFYTIDQVAETFALPDSTFQKLRPRFILINSSVKQININTATVDEMKVHPYIRYNLANAIIQYRTQHGKFIAVSDIKKMMMVTDDIYKKIAPYLSVE